MSQDSSIREHCLQVISRRIITPRCVHTQNATYWFLMEVAVNPTLNNDACGGDILLLFIILFYSTSYGLPRAGDNGQMLVFFPELQCILSFDRRDGSIAFMMVIRQFPLNVGT